MALPRGSGAVNGRRSKNTVVVRCNCNCVGNRQGVPAICKTAAAGRENRGIMQIRKTMPQDLDQIMGIYAVARDFMASHGNPRQWGIRNWPPRELIEEDIRKGNSYVCVDEGRIVGTFYFVYGKDIEPTYSVIEDGSWMDPGPYGVVHRIASDGSVKGTGAYCINWAYSQCGHLRIDTHRDNKVMQGLLTKLGFVYCGTIYVHEDHDPRMAYEKLPRLDDGLLDEREEESAE